MSSFRFTAIDPEGREQTGLLEADSARLARAQLRDRGWLPIKVDSVQGETSRTGSKPWRQRLSRSELVLMTEQLATLVNAGLPLEKTLSAVLAQTEEAKTRTVLSLLRSEILAGKSLTQALMAAPGVFSPLYCSLVQAGEQSGHLDEVLTRLADYLDKRQQTQQKVVLALAYPAVVTLVAIGVIIALMTYVVPQVVGVFIQTKQALPVLTRGLLVLSDFFRHWGIAVLVGLVAVLLVVGRALRMPSIRYRFQENVLKWVLIGRLLRAMNTARMASTLSILVGSGVPLLTALETAKGLMSMLPMQAALTDAMQKVREGVSLARALQTTGRFPPVLIHLIGSGEQSGTLADMLERAAQQQEQEVSRKVTAFTTIMEPLLILVMGGIVLLIVLAIMLPIIDMNQIIR